MAPSGPITTTTTRSRNASFLTAATSVPLGPIQLEWTGGPYTDLFELYKGEISQEGLIYRGSSNSFEYTATESGTVEFHLVALNLNGSNPNPASVLVLFLPTQSEDALWTSGMHWNYSLVPGTAQIAPLRLLEPKILLMRSEEAFNLPRAGR